MLRFTASDKYSILMTYRHKDILIIFLKQQIETKHFINFGETFFLCDIITVILLLITKQNCTNIYLISLHFNKSYLENYHTNMCVDE